MKEFEKNIIIDLRNYPNDVLYKIAEYLFPTSIGCTRTNSTVQNYPEVVKWDHIQSFGRRNPKVFITPSTEYTKNNAINARLVIQC